MKPTTYRRPDPDPEHCFKMSCYGTCSRGAKGCISHHGIVYVELHDHTNVELVSKTGFGQVASVTIRCDGKLYIMSPESLRTFSYARTRREYFERLCTKSR